MCAWPAPTQDDLDLPDNHAPEVDDVALRFDGYAYSGSLDAAFQVAERVYLLLEQDRLRDATTPELRVALFARQRVERMAGESLLRKDVAPILMELRSRIEAASLVLHHELFESMWDGIQRNERLLSGVYARAAPEASVVAAAVDGLMSRATQAGPCWDVTMECALQGVSRIDLVVRSTTPETPAIPIELKTLWPNGQREGIGGIERDRAKLRGLGGYAVALAYAVHQGAARSRQTKIPLESCVAGAEEALGRLWWRSPVSHFEQRDIVGDHQLLVWKCE